jgi:HlyD family secretion protein
MNSRPQYSQAAVLLASVAFFAACQSEQTQTTSIVNTYTVSREDLPINVKEGGELVAVKETVVRSLIEGNATILSLIPEGTLVKTGDKLVELDVSSLVEKRASQEIAVEKARNALEQAKTAGNILEKELITKQNTADSKRQIAEMELEKLLGAKDGKGSEGRNEDMVKRLQELVTAPVEVEDEPVAQPDPAAGTENGTEQPAQQRQLVAQVHPQNYSGLIAKVTELLRVEGEAGDPLQRDMGEMANKILQQADQIRLAMADLKNKEDTVAHSRTLAAKQFITRNELERDELAYQAQASKVTIAWNDLELLINYTLKSSKIELKQNLANAELEVERVIASNNAERSNSAFDVEAKQKEWEVATERLQNLEKQIGNAVIFSPGSGLVVYSKVSQGRGDSQPMEEGTSVRERQSIIILPDNTELMCEVKVQEAMIDKVKVGMGAHISAEVRPNETMTGRVVYVAPVADSASRWSGNDKKVYTTKILLDGLNSDDSLKAGMKASATITVTTIKDVITAPIQSVRRDRSVNYVWKLTPEGAKAVEVVVGANNQEKVEIVSGLAKGDRIFRTPPGGQADPKFDQPALPEVAPAKEANVGGGSVPGNDSIPGNVVKTSPNAADGRGPSSEESNGGGRPGGGGRSGRSRKKYTEMSPEELASSKEQLLAMPERMGAMLDEERMTKLNTAINAIVKAIEANDLAGAQSLRDAMMKEAMGGGRRGAQGGGRQRGNASERGGE